MLKMTHIIFPAVRVQCTKLVIPSFAELYFHLIVPIVAGLIIGLVKR
jgi:hypothetical protein